MDIQHLRCFLATCDAGSYSQAAKLLYTSRQVVSRAVRSLETVMGARLVRPEGAGVVPTPEGRVFYGRAREVVDAFDALFEWGAGALGADGGRPDLRLVCTTTLLSSALPNLFGALEAYADAPGGCRLRVEERQDETCRQAVLDGDADAMLALCMERDFAPCRREDLFEAPLGVAVGEGSPLAAKDALALDDLRGVPMVTTSGFDFKFAALIEACSGEGFSLRRTHCLGTLSLALQSAARDEAVVLLCYREGMPMPEGVRLVPLDDPRLCWHVYLVYLENGERVRQVRGLTGYLRANLPRWTDVCQGSGTLTHSSGGVCQSA